MSSISSRTSAALLGFLLFSCSGSISVSDRSVILAPEQAREIARFASGFWMPSRFDIAELEMRLPAFIATQKFMNRSVAKDYKQYVGIIRDNRRLVFVNAFIMPGDAAPPRGWRSRGILWGGGGNGVWHVEFDPESKAFQSFGMNGPF